MGEIIYWAGAFVAGGFLGIFYFGSLWWTVRRLFTMRHPVIYTIGGYAGRIIVTLLVFFLMVRSGGWQALLACLLGFIVARYVLVRIWGRVPKDKYPVQKE